MCLYNQADEISIQELETMDASHDQLHRVLSSTFEIANWYRADREFSRSY